MSIEAFAAVLHARIGHPGLKLVLLAVADEARTTEAGEWVTFASIERFTHLAERVDSTIRADLKKLQELGWLVQRPRTDRERLRRGEFLYEYALDREKIVTARNPYFRDRPPRLSGGGQRETTAGDRRRSGPQPPPIEASTTADPANDHRRSTAAPIDEPLENPIEPSARTGFASKPGSPPPPADVIQRILSAMRPAWSAQGLGERPVAWMRACGWRHDPPGLLTPNQPTYWELARAIPKAARAALGVEVLP